nr:hypothetical protein [Microbacterium barkeri]
MSLAPVTVCMSTISGTASASAVATSSCPIFWSISTRQNATTP